MNAGEWQRETLLSLLRRLEAGESRQLLWLDDRTRELCENHLKHSQNWTLVSSASEADVLVSLFNLAPDVPSRCHIIVGLMPGNAPVPPGWQVAWSHAARRQMPLREWALATKEGFAATAIRKGLHWIRRTSFAETVGGRVFSFRVNGWRKVILIRQGASPVNLKQAASLRSLLLRVFGLGDLPLVGATLASLVPVIFAAVLMISGLSQWTGWVMAALCALSTIGCVLWEPFSHRHFGAEDAREVVLDEVAGMALSLAMLGLAGSLTGGSLVAAYVLFRVFDIFKPGIRAFEKLSLRGMIVWDDLLAGLYAGICVLLGQWLLR